MIYIVAALHAEAAAFIHKYQLKQCEKKPFSIYQSDLITLVISGMGKIEAAAATSYLLTRYQTTNEDRLLNIGTAASTQHAIEIGTMQEIKKVIDLCSERVYHLEQGEATLTCVDKARHSTAGIKTTLIDMESAGVLVAAKKFFPHNHIKIIKVVSDYTDTTIPHPQDIQALMEKQLANIGAFIDA